MEANSSMAALGSDLAPVYGRKEDLAAGMRRETLTELRVFFRQRADMLEAITPGCKDCAHLSGIICRKFQAAIPDDYAGDDCAEWNWCGVPW